MNCVRLATRLLVSPEDVAPTDPRFRIMGVFNPGAARLPSGEVVLLIRVAQGVAKPIADGLLHSPRSVVGADGRPHYEVDRLPIAPGGELDHRKPLLTTGQRRLAFISHLVLVRLAADGSTVTSIATHEQLFGANATEEYGVEDPRITEIDGTWYITYVSVSEGMGVCTSLMSTKDFVSFDRHGPILPCENKDVVLFPERIGDDYHCFHRPVGRINIRKTAICHADSPDLLRWGRHHRVLGCSSDATCWYGGRIGGGTPPLATGAGWLSLFHGVRYAGPDDLIGRYTAGALLTDRQHPERVLAVSREPFLYAETDFELDGYVNDVIFPTGWVRDLEDPDRVLVYYGCADSRVAVTSFSLAAILDTLEEP